MARARRARKTFLRLTSCQVFDLYSALALSTRKQSFGFVACQRSAGVCAHGDYRWPGPWRYLNGFDQLAETTVQRNLVVWLNEYFGEVKQEGASFQDMAVYKAHRDKIHDVVAVVRRNADTFGKDVARGFVLNG
jgi:hypothetical protein